MIFICNGKVEISFLDFPRKNKQKQLSFRCKKFRSPTKSTHYKLSIEVQTSVIIFCSLRGFLFYLELLRLFNFPPQLHLNFCGKALSFTAKQITRNDDSSFDNPFLLFVFVLLEARIVMRTTVSMIPK